MNISQHFSPPLKYVAPYFVSGVFFYTLSILILYFIDISAVSLMDPVLVSFVHIFLIGFVMMSIFASIAQILPVVFEAKHKHISLFRFIWVFIAVGVSLMATGFLHYAPLIPVGGGVVFTGLAFYLYNFFLTVIKVKKNNFTLKTIITANIFLLAGVLIGILMALGHAGIVNIEIFSILSSHIFLLAGGFISLTIMGVSLVLLPMFGTTKGFSKLPIKISILTMCVSVALGVLADILDKSSFNFFASAFIIISFSIYLYQIFLIYKNRAIKTFDIYIKSLLVSGGSLVGSLVFFISYLIEPDSKYLLSGFWLLFGGFFGFIIIAHLYKIVPFLVWFHRFSQYVGEKDVPMLYEMYNEKHGLIQLYFSTFGLVIISIGIIIGQTILFKIGITFSFVGSLTLLYTIVKLFQTR